jgi:dipeptidyl aminopeptidase/acylaminoacyl peptidase
MFLKIAIFFNLTLFLIQASYSQRRAIDSNDLKSWPSVQFPSISPHGDYLIYYLYNMPEGKSTLVMTSSKGVWKRQFTDCADASFSNDGTWIIFRRMDTVCLLKPGTNIEWNIPHVAFYKLSPNSQNKMLVCRSDSDRSSILLIDLLSRKSIVINSVTDFHFDNTGDCLLVQTVEKKDGISNNYVQLVDFLSKKRDTIWKSANIEGNNTKATNFVFSEKSAFLTFLTEDQKGDFINRTIWRYNLKGHTREMIITDKQLNFDHYSGISPSFLKMSDDGYQVFFGLKPVSSADHIRKDNGVDIWSTSDEVLDPKNGDIIRNFSIINEGFNVFVFNSGEKSIIPLTSGHESASFPNRQKRIDYILVRDCRGDNREANWNPAARSSFFIVSCRDGTRTLFLNEVSEIQAFPEISPTGKFIIYYDPLRNNYFSYEIGTKITRNITDKIATKWVDKENDKPALSLTWRPMNRTWLKDDTAVLISDNNDIWIVDPRSIKQPLNLTHGYGAKNNIKFTLAMSELELQETSFKKYAKVLLYAFDKGDKRSAFCWQRIEDKNCPDLNMEPFRYSPPQQYAIPTKALDANVYFVKRMNATEAPNLFLTSDFKKYIRLTDLQPQKSCNWFMPELFSWKTFDNSYSQGILYKPDNFDSTKKYPIIFTFYERQSDDLNNFIEPAFTKGPINIPWFVSREYLVFVPDVHYELGSPAKSVYNCVASAAQYLSEFPWIDKSKMAIQGHSWGGYQVNALITQTNIFAAAAEAGGSSDFISDCGLLSHGGLTRTFFFEVGQCRIGQSLWGNPDLYLENSPILKANKVQTPLLIMHNKNDNNVPWTEGLEWFNALRRNRKKAWWLQYDNGGHTITNNDAKDYTTKLTEFFDYYLKDKSIPVWMKN